MHSSSAHSRGKETHGRQLPLPCRAWPLEGESLESVCRRLARANGITSGALLREYSQCEPDTEPLLAPLASALGIREKVLEERTFIRVLRSTGRKRTLLSLRGKPWICRSCSDRGTQATLRGTVLQFVCLECGTLLSRSEDVAEPTTFASSALIELQREMLRHIDSSAVHTRISMLEALLRNGVAIGRRMISSESWAQELSQRVSMTQPNGASGRVEIGPLGVAEHPALNAEVWLRVWDLVESTFVLLLTQKALSNAYPYKPILAAAPPHPIPRLRECMPFSRGAMDPSQVGKRIREMAHEANLRSHDVPDEVRYSHDPFILDWHEWLWRRHICSALRLWLNEIERKSGIIYSLRTRADWEDYRGGRSHYSYAWETHRNWDVGTVSYITSDDAAAFTSQIITLAEELADQKRIDKSDPRTLISTTSLRGILPRQEVLSSDDIELARYWMWLDEVFGKNVHGYFPSVSPERLEHFDRKLLPEERLALREYREYQQATDVLEHRTGVTGPRIRWSEVG